MRFSEQNMESSKKKFYSTYNKVGNFYFAKKLLMSSHLIKRFGCQKINLHEFVRL